jgi:hypothetical protein
MSAEPVLRLDDFDIARADIERGREPGLFAKSIARLTIRLSLDTNAEVKRLDDVLARQIVTVSDLADRREFKGLVSQLSTSPRDDGPGKHYSFDVAEWEALPKFDAIAIDGVEYPIVAIGATAVDKIPMLECVLSLEATGPEDPRPEISADGQRVSLKLVGVESEPLSLTLGSAMAWSETQVNGDTSRRQLLRLFMPDFKLPE